MRRLILLGLIAGCAGAAGMEQAAAQTLYVDNVAACAGLAPCYPTITEAVNAAPALGLIEVFPGVYRGTVRFDGTRGLVLRGHDPAVPPLIAAPEGGASAVVIDASPSTQILGFAIEAPEAAAISVSIAGSAGSIIRGNLIKALYGVRLTNTGGVTIADNTIDGGIYADGGRSLSIEGNAIRGDVRIDESPSTHVLDNLVRSNTVRDGSIVITGGTPRSDGGAVNNLVESNLVIDGFVRLVPLKGRDNTIRDNRVRGGGIEVGHGALQTLVEGNFVSGSPADGILASATGVPPGIGNPWFGGRNTFHANTSVENAGCDLNDAGATGTYPNTWSESRFQTSCGFVTDCPSPATWYRDGDGDGFGTAEQWAACNRPAGFADTGGDCDDRNAAIHAGASDTCNGIDDDCDGAIDDGPSLATSCDDGNVCTIDACGAGACIHAAAVVPQATCAPDSAILNPASQGSPFGLTIALIDRCTGQGLDVSRLSPIYVAAVATPRAGRTNLPVPYSGVGCTQDGIWETPAKRTLLAPSSLATHFKAPSDGHCETLDGNRQDIIRWLGDVGAGDQVEVSFAASYPGAAAAIACTVPLTVRGRPR
jgi:hypothetical protein